MKLAELEKYELYDLNILTLIYSFIFLSEIILLLCCRKQAKNSLPERTNWVILSIFWFCCGIIFYLSCKILLYFNETESKFLPQQDLFANDILIEIEAFRNITLSFS